MNDFFSVDAVAKIAGVSYFVIDYHERMGRLPTPSKIRGARIYNLADAQKIKEYFKVWKDRPRKSKTVA